MIGMDRRVPAGCQTSQLFIGTLEGDLKADILRFLMNAASRLAHARSLVLLSLRLPSPYVSF